MKYIFFTGFLSLFIFTNINAQSSFEGLQIIKKFQKKNNSLITKNEQERSVVNNFNSFLSNPFSENIKPLDLKLLNEILEREQIIAYAPDNTDDKKTQPLQIVETQKQILDFEKLTPNGVNLSTQVIDALTKHIIKQTKNELNLLFFENFQQQLDKSITLRIDSENFTVKLKELLPNTILLIESKELFNTPSFGQTWITAFKKDLNNLVFTTISALEKKEGFMTTNTGRYLSMLSLALKQVKNEKHPMLVFSELSKTFDNTNAFPIDRNINFLNLIAESFVKKENGVKTWVSTSDIENLDLESQKYLTGLIYQKGHHNRIFTKTLKDSLFKNPKTFINNSVSVLSELTDTQRKLNLTIEADDDKKVERSLIFLQAFLQSINKSFEVIAKLENKEKDYYQSDYYKTFKPLSQELINFTNALYSGNSGACLLSTVSFINQISKGNTKNEAMKKLLFYGNFLVDIINASENEAVKMEDVISNYASPVGSYRMKRNNRYSIDLNSYPGLYFGYESSSNKGLISGVTAPVGFSFSWSKSREPEELNKPKPSHTLFISVIDIGAPFIYRWVKNNDVELPENIKWEHVFAPGVSYIHGFKKAPLGFMFGVQLAPMLSGISDANNYRAKNIIRYNAALTIDIPIFNLKSTSNEAKKSKDNHSNKKV